MIRAYTTNSATAAALEQAAHLKGIPLQIQVEFDAEALAGALDNITVLVFDLHDHAFLPEHIVPQLDAMESEHMPPVLYLLSGSAQIELLAEVENIANQDYAFPPFSPDSLALRFEVLTLLGSRRRMTLESAITDKLTGLYNRKYFLRRLEEELFRARRYGYSIGVILADLDFSADGAGLSENDGTAAIKQVAEFLYGRLRNTDVVARFRWSQFAVLLPNIPAEDSAAVAADLKQKVEAMEVAAGDHKVRLRAAVGHLVAPLEGLSTALEVVEAAEDAAFAAKSSPDGGVVTHSQ